MSLTPDEAGNPDALPTVPAPTPPTRKLIHGAEIPMLGLGTSPVVGEEVVRMVVTALHAGYRLVEGGQGAAALACVPRSKALARALVAQAAAAEQRSTTHAHRAGHATSRRARPIDPRQLLTRASDGNDRRTDARTRS